jgi:hypothetical protein
MGSGPSKKELTPEQQDIKRLGDRMPFGDAELYQVYKAYHGMKDKADRVSFLTDIGLLSLSVSAKITNTNTNTPEGDSSDEERLVLLQAVERKLLPLDFGNRLYQSAFLRPQDVSAYDSNAPSAPPPDDEYSRSAKLEAFFDGLSNCSRRGSKKTLKVLMDCCQQHEAPKLEPTTTTTSTTTLDFNNGGYATSHNNTAPTMTTLIEPLELVNIGYRVALASAFLSATTQSNDEHQDIGRFFPAEDAASQPAGLQALAESLIEFATKRRQRIQRSMTPCSEDEKVTLVDEHDVNEWAEQVAPMFASSLATLCHMLFFPDRPYPPTRTSFDYPSISGFDSTFFSEGSSSLLFSFGCMSPALNGEVRERDQENVCNRPV